MGNVPVEGLAVLPGLLAGNAIAATVALVIAVLFAQLEELV